MTETADELLLVQLIGSHLHPSHLDHLLIKVNEVLLGRFNFQAWHVMFEDTEGFFRQLDLEGLRGRGRRRRHGYSRVCCEMDEASWSWRKGAQEL